MEKEKRIAYSLLSDLNWDTSLTNLIAYAKKIGWKVVYYGKDDISRELLTALELEEFAQNVPAFCYRNQKNGFIFIKDCYDIESKRCLLSHELGHIKCGHFQYFSCYCENSNILEETQANEFSHYLLHPGAWSKLKHRLLKPKSKKLATAIALIVLGILLLTSSDKPFHADQLFFSESNTIVYITKSGDSYHNADCYTIKGHAQISLTQENAQDSGYHPCKVCRPDK